MNVVLIWRHPIAGVALALSLASSPQASADDAAQKRTVASVVSAYGSMWLVASPALAVSAAVDSVNTASERESRSPAGREKAAPRPPLQIRDIRKQANGDYHIDVEAQGDTAQRGTMLWAARPDNPAATLKAGDTLKLTPTTTGSGWWVRTEGDHVLAFMPTADSGHHVLSEPLPP